MTIGLLFVVSAYICSKDAKARKAATADTALVFPWQPEWFTLAGVLWDVDRRIVGSARHLPRFGALSLTLFLPPAAMIHFRKARQAASLKEAILAVGKTSGVRHEVTVLGASAALGNCPAALKTLTLRALTL